MSGLMSTSQSRSARRDSQLNEEIRKLSQRVAELTGEVAALSALKDRTQELRDVEERLERIKLEKAGIEEAQKRKEREVEHKVGLLLQTQEQDLKTARKETELQVREQNLDLDKARFEQEMAFQRTHLEKQVSDMQGLMAQILERLPVISVELEGGMPVTKGKVKRDE